MDFFLTLKSQAWMKNEEVFKKIQSSLEGKPIFKKNRSTRKVRVQKTSACRRKGQRNISILRFSRNLLYIKATPEIEGFHLQFPSAPSFTMFNGSQ